MSGLKGTLKPTESGAHSVFEKPGEHPCQVVISLKITSKILRPLISKPCKRKEVLLS